MPKQLTDTELAKIGLVGVDTTTWATSVSAQFAEPFNQATFLNYDENEPVTILDNIVIPPAQAVTGGVQPSQFKINLNVGEVNATNYRIMINSDTANLVIIYTQYHGLL